MEMFHIGPDEKKLVCVFHPANDCKLRKTGIIICNPIGQEYIRFYKAISLLSTELSMEGYSTFRFDYFGTGDSYGDNEDLTIESGLNDLKNVIKEMREGGGIQGICLVGIRFGTILSLLAASEPEIIALVLWNPLFSGKAMFDDLVSQNNKFISSSFCRVNPKVKHEYYGFSYSPDFITGLKNFHFKNVFPSNLKNVLVLADSDEKVAAELCVSNYVKLRTIVNQTHKFWTKEKDESSKSMVPIVEIKEIVNWLNDTVE